MRHCYNGNKYQSNGKDTTLKTVFLKRVAPPLIADKVVILDGRGVQAVGLSHDGRVFTGRTRHVTGRATVP